MKNIKNLLLAITVIALAVLTTACSAINPYLDKAAETSIEVSTKALEAAVFYECDRARVGDLMRRYPDVDNLMNHLKWCADKNKKNQWVAPESNND